MTLLRSIVDILVTKSSLSVRSLLAFYRFRCLNSLLDTVEVNQTKYCNLQSITLFAIHGSLSKYTTVCFRNNWFRLYNPRNVMVLLAF